MEAMNMQKFYDNSMILCCFFVIPSFGDIANGCADLSLRTRNVLIFPARSGVFPHVRIHFAEGELGTFDADSGS